MQIATLFLGVIGEGEPCCGVGRLWSGHTYYLWMVSIMPLLEKGL